MYSATYSDLCEGLTPATVPNLFLPALTTFPHGTKPCGLYVIRLLPNWDLCPIEPLENTKISSLLTIGLFLA